ncbi:hypothetical protein PR048_009033 [Dryococelus australis]|uniref:Uncharacterized protein n=1 Tax=Dryococelus australis TaxID=614101 RepID=A0ABQ9HYT4_9NEOP|nr:hypothetical protein PR048_009033 [Dryococelus australis]
MFVNIDQRLSDSGSLSANMRDTGLPRQVRTPQLEEEVLHAFEESPTSSTQKVNRQTGVDRRIVWDVFKYNELNPPLEQRAQTLSWAITHCDLLFTEEAFFTREGMLNAHNSHFWAHDNPHTTFEHGAYERYVVDIIGDNLIRPYILPPRLDGQKGVARFFKMYHLLCDARCDFYMMMTQPTLPQHRETTSQQCLATGVVWCLGRLNSTSFFSVGSHERAGVLSIS